MGNEIQEFYSESGLSWFIDTVSSSSLYVLGIFKLLCVVKFLSVFNE